jgi:hypothetical protein
MEITWINTAPDGDGYAVTATFCESVNKEDYPADTRSRLENLLDTPDEYSPMVFSHIFRWKRPGWDVIVVFGPEAMMLTVSGYDLEARQEYITWLLRSAGLNPMSDYTCQRIGDAIEALKILYPKITTT